MPTILTNRKNDSEASEQIAIMRYLDLKGIPAFHIPNGGKRNLVEAVKFKRLGVKPGIPDIFIPVARSCHHGLFLEVKRVKNSYLSDAQQWWIEELSRQGYQVHVVHGAEQGIRLIDIYMGIKGGANLANVANVANHCI